MEEYNQKLVCPVCLFDYVHMESPVENNCQNTNGTIKIPMYCENDHKWNLVFEHHKGETFIYCESKNTIRFKTRIVL